MHKAVGRLSPARLDPVPERVNLEMWEKIPREKRKRNCKFTGYSHAAPGSQRELRWHCSR
ncbi:hypothetical protein EMIT0196MI5_260008 [Pseudomonas sp. IT-196MI5]